MPLSSTNFRSTPSLLWFLLPAVIGLAADLYTKKVAFEKLAPWGVETRDNGRVVVNIPPGEDQPVHRFLPRWLHFQAMANQGAVFGIGQGQRWLFLGVSVAAIGFITYLFATSGRQRFYQFILGLLLAGVLGNMYDRVRFGFVRDMIYIFPSRILFGREVFPWIFNVADSLLCVGVALIFVYSLRAPKEERERVGGQPDQPKALGAADA
jgi:lipoprotein signal peptidase